MTLIRVRSVDREPIVYNDNEPTGMQTCDDDTSLFTFNSPLTERRASSANHLFTLHTAAHADHRAWQGSHSNSAREILHAIFARGGVGRHAVLSVCYT